MSQSLRYFLADDRSAELFQGDTLLLRYNFRPETAADESPRPYAHPVCSLAGETLTNFRPTDHRWHHGLSFTITRVSGHNFWGGVTYRKADGYQWRGDHGVQIHTGWLEMSAHRFAHALDWRVGATGELLLQEERALAFDLVSHKAWTLRWTATLKNVTSRTLELGHYHSSEGLIGSHYSGLQFRGARDLLDDHGDAAIGITCDGGVEGETAVHGAPGRWMEWRGQKDTTQRRVTIRFESQARPFHCFVRRHNPLAAIPFHYDRDVPLAAGESLAVDHTLTFTDE